MLLERVREDLSRGGDLPSGLETGLGSEVERGFHCSLKKGLPCGVSWIPLVSSAQTPSRCLQHGLTRLKTVHRVHCCSHFRHSGFLFLTFTKSLITTVDIYLIFLEFTYILNLQVDLSKPKYMNSHRITAMIYFFQTYDAMIIHSHVHSFLPCFLTSCEVPTALSDFLHRRRSLSSWGIR